MGRSIHDETMEWVRVVLLSIEQTSGMNRLWETQHRRCDDGEQTALEEERRMVSGMEVSSWVGRDLRIGWCVEEKERGGERRGEEEEEREWIYLSLLLPINSPAGLTPCGDTLSNHSPNTLPLNPYPSNPDPKMGDPHLLPTRGKGGKRGGKGHFLHILSSIFLSGGEPPDPPF